MEPPPYDPTVRCLGRVLSDAEANRHSCPKQMLYQRLNRKSPDLAWAVLHGDEWRVMRLKQMNENGLVVFVTGGQINHCEWVVSIWGKAWPMVGFTVNRGDGWLKRMMREIFKLRIRKPLVHYSAYEDVPARLAMASPQLDPNVGRMSRHERLYVFTVDEKLMFDRKRAGKSVGGFRAYSWQPASVRQIYHGGEIKVEVNNGLEVTFTKGETYRLRVIHAIPISVVNRANMWRMTVMFYAMRLNFVERGVRDRRRFEFVCPLEIVRWNPFYYIGVDLCCKIARLLDCCDDNGVLLEAFRTP